MKFREPTFEAKLSAGTIRYRDAGAGETILLIHGLLVDGTVWRKVAPRLHGEFRVIVPDWPMGSHRVPMKPDADLSVAGMAKLIVEFMTKLDLDRVTIVGSDTGGAICQIIATRYPERLARLVLTNCDACEDFPLYARGPAGAPRRADRRVCSRNLSPTGSAPARALAHRRRLFP